MIYVALTGLSFSLTKDEISGILLDKLRSDCYPQNEGSFISIGNFPF